MSLFETLKETYLNERVEPYGDVVIVPIKAFQNEWKEQLEADGVKIFSSNYGMQSAFFLRKGKRQASTTEKSSTQQEEPVSEKEETIKGKWNFEETQELSQLYSQGKTMQEIAQQLNRTVPSVTNKIHELGLSKPSVEVLAKSQKPVKKKPWTHEERNKLKELLNQGLSTKQIAERLGKSVFQVGGAIRYLPHITPLPKRGSSTKKTNPQLELDNPADADLVKEYLSAISLLYPSHRRVCSLLLREAANVMETTP